ncbi:MAG: M48 family metalloprotease [Bacteroides sp.]|nr:M48 family metalloprotease [Bacteroides sp.]
MKKLLPFILLLITLTVFAQRNQTNLSGLLNIPGTFKKSYESYPAGMEFELIKVIKLSRNNVDPTKTGVLLMLNINYNQIVLPASKVDILDLHTTTREDFWQSVFLYENMYAHYDNKGYRNDIRQDLLEESVEYLGNLSGLFYEDGYVQDYVHRLFMSTKPVNVNNQRPEVLSVRLLKSPSPDAYMLPNGTLLISTGLLSVLDSEEELTAIIVSEVAHYFLDHQVINVMKAESRTRRAEFWSGMLEIVAAGFDEYFTYKNEYYVPGTTYLGANIIAAIINSRTNARLGMAYTQKQESKADQIACDYLAFQGMDPAALSSALIKIRNYYEEARDYYTLSRYGIYAEMDERIERLPEPKEFQSRSYQKTMCGVTTFNALLHQAGNQYEQSIAVLEKNIERKLVTGEDLTLLAKAHMQLYDSPEANLEALDILAQAKEMARFPNPNAYKQEILLLLRLNRQARAADALVEYMELLSSQYKAGNIDDAAWMSSEMNWANKLLQRIELF